nr:helix-turn-helix transcriptional regulator [Deltaproteobacteria bacterium]
SPAQLAHVQRTARAWATLAKLSPRELDVARLVAGGAKSAEIGQQLHITTRTVNTHLEHVYDRLGIRSRTVLARLVIEARLDDDGV